MKNSYLATRLTIFAHWFLIFYICIPHTHTREKYVIFYKMKISRKTIVSIFLSCHEVWHASWIGTYKGLLYKMEIYKEESSPSAGLFSDLHILALWDHLIYRQALGDERNCHTDLVVAETNKNPHNKRHVLSGTFLITDRSAIATAKREVGDIWK